MSIQNRTIDLLTHWGRWSRLERGLPRCKPAMECVMRGNVAEDSDAPMRITDDDALMIDGIVSRLIGKDYEMGKVLSLYYQSHDQSMRAVARQMDIHRSRVERVLSSAEAWIDGVLDARLLMAA